MFMGKLTFVLVLEKISKSWASKKKRREKQGWRWGEDIPERAYSMMFSGSVCVRTSYDLSQHCCRTNMIDLNVT